MKRPMDYVFLPTPALLQLAGGLDVAWLVEPSAWTTSVGPAGPDHPRPAVEAAFWAVFRANLCWDDETPAQRGFREHCLALGFAGCWHVLQVRAGGEAADLIEESREAEDSQDAGVGPGMDR